MLNISVLKSPKEDQEGVGLYRVRCHPTQAAWSLNVIVPLTEVAHALELVLVFDSKIPGIEISNKMCLHAERN